MRRRRTDSSHPGTCGKGTLLDARRRALTRNLLPQLRELPLHLRRLHPLSHALEVGVDPALQVAALAACAGFEGVLDDIAPQLGRHHESVRSFHALLEASTQCNLMRQVHPKTTYLLLTTLIARPLHANARALLIVVVLDAGPRRLEVELGSVGRPLARLGLASGRRLHFDAIAVCWRLNAASCWAHLHKGGFLEGVGCRIVRCRRLVWHALADR